jgi:uncharacterized membrane protein YhaH (DUF805 family)
MSQPYPPPGPPANNAGPTANWYLDQSRPGYMRYWDGVQWTDHVTQIPAGPLHSSQPTDPLDIPGGQPYVGFGRSVGLGFKQYVRFSGRSSRSEYWWWYLFNSIVSAIVLTPGYIQFFHTFIPAWTKFLDCYRTNINNPDVNIAEVCKLTSGTPWLLWLGQLLLLPLFLPSLGVLIRRLHDTGRSGWWMWISLIPVAGSIILIVWLATASQPEPNQYGLPAHKGAPVAGPTGPSA